MKKLNDMTREEALVGAIELERWRQKYVSVNAIAEKLGVNRNTVLNRARRLLKFNETN